MVFSQKCPIVPSPSPHSGKEARGKSQKNVSIPRQISKSVSSRQYTPDPANLRLRIFTCFEDDSQFTGLQAYTVHLTVLLNFTNPADLVQCIVGLSSL